MISIYKLTDPRCGSIRYIGKTNSELSDRLKVHIHQSKIAKKPTHKEAWIKQLLSLGLRPISELVCLVSEDDWREEEVMQIKTHREQGHKLTNLTDGGDGAGALKHSEEFKASLSERMKGNKYGEGRKWTPEQREKMKNRKVWNKGKKGTVRHTEQHKEKMSKIMSDNHPMAKLTVEDVFSIVRRYESGQGANALAIEYGVTYSHLIKVATKKTHKALWL
jgi:hypothetical protein